MGTRFITLFITSILLLAGCAEVPPLNFAVPNVGISKKKINAEVKSITVSIARPEEATGTLDFGSVSIRKSDKLMGEQMVPQQWHIALQNSVNAMAIFLDDAPMKVNLTVKILKLDIGRFTIPMRTFAEARYELMDRKSGDIIYTQVISSVGPAEYGSSLDGETVSRGTINRAIQSNIMQFLQALETVDVQKPMFPAKSAGSN